MVFVECGRPMLGLCVPSSSLWSCSSSTAPVQQLEGQAAVLSPNSGIKRHIFNFWVTAQGVSDKSILADFKGFFFSFSFLIQEASLSLFLDFMVDSSSLNLVIYNTQIHPKL